MNFYLVCAWDNYYPPHGIDGIRLVTLSKKEAYDYMKILKAKVYPHDHVQVFQSSDLPWSEK